MNLIKSKKRNIITAFILTLITGLTIKYCISHFGRVYNIDDNQSVLLFLQEKYSDELIIYPVEILKTVHIENNKTLVIYSNSENNIACSVWTKGTFGYKLIRTSGVLCPKSKTVRVGAIYSLIEKPNTNLCWGIIYDESIKRIEVLDSKVPFIYKFDDMSFFYYLESDFGTKSRQLSLFDKDGIEVKNYL